MRSMMSLGRNGVSRDKVHIEKQGIRAIIGPDCWNRTVPQDCQISLEMTTNFSKASQSDELRYSLNYAVISKEVARFVDTNKDYKTLGKLADKVLHHVKNKYLGIEKLALTAEAQEAHIRAENIRLLIHAPQEHPYTDRLVISGLKLLTLIGVFTFERMQKQYVTIDIDVPWDKHSDSNINHQKVIQEVVSFVEASNFKTVEALVECVAHLALLQPYFEQNRSAAVIVKVLKLNAITATEGVGVSCTRTLADFSGKEVPKVGQSQFLSEVFDLPAVQVTPVVSGKPSVAYLAFGTNVGNRLANIQCAIDLLNANADVIVRKTSSIFESEPMYFQNQPQFLNGCLEIETRLSPNDLLRLCKHIEYEDLKRVKEFENGPRSIDLDIILYKNGNGEDIVMSTADLVVPHPRLIERTFVMEPLCELVPPNEVHPVTAEPIINHLNQVYEQLNDEDVLCKLIPLPKINGADRFLKFKNKLIKDTVSGRLTAATVSPTLTMGIVNTTPDSFSDGGKLGNDVSSQLLRIKEMVQDVLSLNEQVIIDIGGCSTRPNSAQATLDEELERTISLIRAVRACDSLPQEKVILSIDTYQSEVAQQAIEAGVDIVNDISGGKFDSNMFTVLANNPAVAYAMSHIRGDIQSMSKLTVYDSEDYNEDAVTEYCYGHEFQNKDSTTLIRALARELAVQYKGALDMGVKSWQIILDPGVGFAKNADQNLDIIRSIHVLKNYSVLKNSEFVNFRNKPILIGPSRKKFIGNITGETSAADRDISTGSVASACVGYGADIIRVHNTANCVKSIKMADSIYRQTRL
ncbi:LAME_0G02674g1_1 [Lachancea meyersii CBS 8951]|uniref:Folic acid synthesis protein fol1 n=1 Tax=Lachancea meyersii CBS 8951 TaxID=1266667 RepID=A0A1G4K655_9SACH|nr:LAME_0G02674g1_1 [Lachancea meyersii CBS 8951]